MRRANSFYHFLLVFSPAWQSEENYRTETLKYYKECDWSKTWAEEIQTILTLERSSHIGHKRLFVYFPFYLVLLNISYVCIIL